MKKSLTTLLLLSSLLSANINTIEVNANEETPVEQTEFLDKRHYLTIKVVQGNHLVEGAPVVIKHGDTVKDFKTNENGEVNLKLLPYSVYEIEVDNNVVAYRSESDHTMSFSFSIVSENIKVDNVEEQSTEAETEELIDSENNIKMLLGLGLASLFSFFVVFPLLNI